MQINLNFINEVQVRLNKFVPLIVTLFSGQIDENSTLQTWEAHLCGAQCEDERHHVQNGPAEAP